jgi:hypothetical protein
MSRETREVRRVSNQQGTITDKAGSAVKVRFSLTQTQDFVDGIPTLRSGEGSLDFESRGDAWKMTSTPESKTLAGGGIKAEVLVISEVWFKTTGPIVDI